MNQYVQPYTFYLIVWLTSLLVAVGAGFLLGYHLRDSGQVKPDPKNRALASQDRKVLTLRDR